MLGNCYFSEMDYPNSLKHYREVLNLLEKSHSSRYEINQAKNRILEVENAEKSKNDSKEAVEK